MAPCIRYARVGFAIERIKDARMGVGVGVDFSGNGRDGG